MKKIIIIILALVVLAVSSFASIYYFMLQKGDKQEVVKEEFYEVGEIFVNLNDKDSKRYVKLNMSISYDIKNKDLAKEITEKIVVLRDTVIFYLKSCIASDFSPENEGKLKNDLVLDINKNLTEGTIIDVYISDIIVQ